MSINNYNSYIRASDLLRHKRFYYFIFFLVISSGCKEKFPVYHTFCEHEGNRSLPCLHYPLMSKEDQEVIETATGRTNDPQCPYHIALTRYHIGNCNNPVVKSTGSDFAGYVRLEIRKGMRCYYKVQSDFRRDEEGAMERVFVQLKNDVRGKK